MCGRCGASAFRRAAMAFQCFVSSPIKYWNCSMLLHAAPRCPIPAPNRPQSPRFRGGKPRASPSRGRSQAPCNGHLASRMAWRSLAPARLQGTPKANRSPVLSGRSFERARHRAGSLLHPKPLSLSCAGRSRPALRQDRRWRGPHPRRIERDWRDLSRLPELDQRILIVIPSSY